MYPVVTNFYSSIIADLERIVRKTGSIILSYYTPSIQSKVKSDGTPVTAADLHADRIIVSHLKQLTPHIPIISEESYSQQDPVPESQFWLVDPLDGTQNFLQHTDEFTINISLVSKGKPIIGMIYAPVQDLLYTAVRGKGATLVQKGDRPRKITVRSPSKEGYLVLLSATNLTETLKSILVDYPIYSYRQMGSSLKMCCIASGQADLYPRLAGTWEWDTAAGQILIEEAGGTVQCYNGETLVYGKSTLRNPGFIAKGM